MTLPIRVFLWSRLQSDNCWHVLAYFLIKRRADDINNKNAARNLLQLSAETFLLNSILALPHPKPNLTFKLPCFVLIFLHWKWQCRKSGIQTWWQNNCRSENEDICNCINLLCLYTDTFCNCLKKYMNQILKFKYLQISVTAPKHGISLIFSCNFLSWFIARSI